MSEDFQKYFKQKTKNHERLLQNIKDNLEEATSLANNIFYVGLGNYEDLVYRYYHHSFKVFRAQEYTKTIFDFLEKIKPTDKELNPLFANIIYKGINQNFDKELHNPAWEYYVEPIINAFLHSVHLLEMIIKYGNKLEEPPKTLPSGWATLLVVYQIR